MGTSVIIGIDKTSQRQQACKKRQKFVESLSLEEKEALAEKLCTTFCSTFLPLGKEAKVAAYWPLPYEADTRPLLKRLHQEGVSLALPCAEKNKPLTFYKWQPGDPLVIGTFQVQEPLKKQSPDTGFTHLIIPLLAFDAKGSRLGYGQGHYDRTVSNMRYSKGKMPKFIGYAFACQQIENLVSDPHDQPLDTILTEKGII